MNVCMSMYGVHLIKAKRFCAFHSKLWSVPHFPVIEGTTEPQWSPEERAQTDHLDMTKDCERDRFQRVAAKDTGREVIEREDVSRKGGRNKEFDEETQSTV